MPDDAPTNPTGSPSTSASSTPPGTGATAPPAEPWRYPADPRYPQYLWGKTADEAAQLANQMYGALVTAASQPQTAQPSTTDPQDEEFVDRKSLRQFAMPFQQSLGQMYVSMAQNNVDRLRDKFPRAFERYGPEISSLIAGMPVESRTLDNLEAVVTFVRGRHVEDEAKSLAQEMASQFDPTARSLGIGGSVPGSPGPLTASEELPVEYRNLLKEKGISEDTIREFCATQGISVKDWYEKAKKHNVNVISERNTIRQGRNV